MKRLFTIIAGNAVTLNRFLMQFNLVSNKMKQISAGAAGSFQIR